MLGTPYKEFMAKEMRINVCSIESKLNEPFFSNFKMIAVDAIEKYIDAIKAFEAKGEDRDLYSCVDNEAEELIRSHYCSLSDEIEDEEVLQVFDALRHSFSCYAYNGLHQLYTRQENEAWHPKVTLIDRLEPNDINKLDSTIKIYRGCDVGEFDTNSYGQAWTTSLDVAKDFAFRHYQSQLWFKKEKRIVVETIYSRDHLLFSDQSIEFEVVVDTKKLSNVKKHT
ncbi:hypothetical protein ACEWAM_22355 [Vibrio parahaemolyticus]